VDNASSDGTADAVRVRWPHVTVIDAGSNLGFARATNVGIRRSSGELVLLLNPDTVVGPGAVARLVAALEDDPQAAAAGPRLIDEQGATELSFGRMVSPLAELRQKLLVAGHRRGLPFISSRVERMTRQRHTADWVSGACLLVRRAMPTLPACSTSATSCTRRRRLSAPRCARGAAASSSFPAPRSCTAAASHAAPPHPRRNGLSPQPARLLRKAPSPLGAVAARVPEGRGRLPAFLLPDCCSILNRMRVAIDARKLHDFGIGTLHPQPAAAPRADRQRDEYVLLCAEPDLGSRRTLGPNFRTVLEPSPNYSLREQIHVPWVLLRERPDVFHAPHYVLPPAIRAVGRHHPRHDPPDVSAVPAQQARRTPTRATRCGTRRERPRVS
jgi:hypothetical protein